MAERMCVARLADRREKVPVTVWLHGLCRVTKVSECHLLELAVRPHPRIAPVRKGRMVLVLLEFPATFKSRLV